MRSKPNSETTKAATPPSHHLQLATRATRDLKAIAKTDRPAYQSIRSGLEELAADAANLDVKVLAGRAPWWRLRVGNFRVIYRRMEQSEVRDVAAFARSGYLIARVVNRRELDQATKNL